MIGQGTAAIAGQSLAAVLGTLAERPAARRGRRRHRVLAASSCATTCPTRWSSPSARAAPPPTPTAPPTSARARGAAVVVDRQPAQQRPGRQVRRRALHVGRARRRDGGTVDQGVLRADRGRVVARRRHRARGRDAADGARVHELLDAPAVAPRRDAPRARAARRHRRDRPPARHSRRYWAVVGNGRNRIAAAEVRVKASELCYKSISFDATEDKKHIDLSAEPLVVVCAAGLQGSNADDVAKEIAIYRAHRAAPIVIATDGERRFDAALETIAGARGARRRRVRALGHGRPSLRVRGRARDRHVGATAARGARRDPVRGLGRATTASTSSPAFDPPSRARRRPSSTACAPAAYDGHLEAGTAVRIASLLRYAIGIVPLDVYQVEHGAVGTPSRVVEDLTAALTAGIEELTRPVDAIKHQAKTVTVGISRSDEELLQVAAGARGAGGGRRARRAQLPRAAHAGRARPRGRAGRRLHPLPHRRRRRRRRRHHPRRGPRRHLPRPALAHRRRPPSRGYQAPRRHPSARSPSPVAAATSAP